MSNEQKSQYVTRDAIMNLLSDNEVAAVSTSETAARLSDGDEYVDLDHLDLGIQRAPAPTIPMGHVLPKKAVQEPTWTKIAARLAIPHGAAAHPNK